MTSPQAISSERADQVLHDAVAHQRHIVLTHHGPTGWRLFKGKLIAGSAGSGSLLAKLSFDAADPGVPLPEPNEPLGATFRLGHKKCLFSTTVESVSRGRDGVTATLRWPKQVQQIQRRVYERAELPPGTLIAVRFWRHDPSEGGPQIRRDVRHGQLEDISCGGMRVKATQAVDVEVGQNYRCAFTVRSGKTPFVMDALLRHREAAEQGRASLGFQFIGLEATDEGRQTLSRLARLINRFNRSRARGRR